MAVVDDIVSELTGSIPKLSTPQAEQLVNRAWRGICDFRWWSWQYLTGQIFQPNAVTVGAATAQYGSTAITMNSIATAALNLVPLQTPVASPILGGGMQIRMNYGNSQTSLNTGQYGPYYNIVKWDGAGHITIDRPFGETSVTSPFSVLKVYYPAPPFPVTSLSTPDTGFKKFDSLVNTSNGYTIFGKRLNFSQVWLNQMDPQRGGTDTPYILAYLQHNSLGAPVYEWYPGPVQQFTWTCSYWSKWPDLSSTIDPPMTSYGLTDLIQFKSQGLAYEWAAKNVSTFPELGRVNWIPLIGLSKQNEMDSKIMCVKEDDNIKVGLPFRQGRIVDFPVGGEFLQNHDLSSLVGN